MMRNKYVYNRIVKLNNKETGLLVINISHVFVVLFYIFLALPNSIYFT